MIRETDIKTGTCPKCGGHDIRFQPWARRPNGHRNYLPFGWWGGGARIVNYACLGCGYLEDYLDPRDLKKVARNWERVTRTAST